MTLEEITNDTLPAIEKKLSGELLLQPQVNATSTEVEEADSRFSSRHCVGITKENYDIVDEVKGEAAPAERLYPHVYDLGGKAGQAVMYLRVAIEDAQAALDAYGEPDLQSVGSRLNQIAVSMSKAHSLSDFNESFSAVIAFIRRATLVASLSELTRSSLNSLLNVLNSTVRNPMMDLDEATDLIEKLANSAWHGEHEVVDQLVAALIGSGQFADDELQGLAQRESQKTI